MRPPYHPAEAAIFERLSGSVTPEEIAALRRATQAARADFAEKLGKNAS